MATSTDMKGNVVKMEVDYSDTVDKRIPECEKLATVSIYRFHEIFCTGNILKNSFVLHVLDSLFVIIFDENFFLRKYDLLSMVLSLFIRMGNSVKHWRFF